jgi:hypothetical protein
MLCVICVICALIVLFLRARFHEAHASAVSKQAEEVSRTPAEYRRATEFTYLTIPEWYLVWSPEEYADYITKKPPSTFPYLGHLKQFWESYHAIYTATADEYPFNRDYHLMIVVIGVSTTVEYGMKWFYENLVGTLTETTQQGQTEEDRLAAQVARDYVDFIVVEPWYKFDFVTPLKRVWSDTGWWGKHPIRKWERKYFLTSEYAIKAAYGWLIKKGSESVYDEEKPTTAVILDRAPVEDPANLSDLKVLTKNDDGTVLALVPRYQAFTTYATSLSKNGANFVEIAGNRGPILISATVPDDFDDSNFSVLIRQPIMTRPGRRRIVFAVPVPQLATVLRRYDSPGIRLEHIYDY